MPRDAYSEITGRRSYIPQAENGEEKKRKKFVPLEEIPGPDSNPLENLIRAEEEGEEAGAREPARLEREEDVAKMIEHEEEAKKARRGEEEKAGWSPKRGEQAKGRDEPVGKPEILVEETGKKSLTRGEKQRLAKERRFARGQRPGERPSQTPPYKTPRDETRFWKAA